MIDKFAPGQVDNHLEVGIGVAQAVNGRDGGYNQTVFPLQQGLGGRQPHLLDMFIDRGILLDIRIRGRHIGFRLVVVVVRNEVLHRIVGEEFLELAVQLRRQRLVMRHDDSGPLQLLDDMGHGERLARARNPQQCLGGKPGTNALYQLGYCLGLVARGLERGLYLEGSGHCATCRLARISPLLWFTWARNAARTVGAGIASEQ